jgi:peptidoglycan/xylan/chitin deacetylase (PgdA/CDA1 family)
MLDQRRKPRKEPAVVLSFDDGLASNFEVLAPMLEELGMRAFFFVNPEFAKTELDRARAYFLEHVYPDWSGSLVEEDYRPMSPNQIVELSRRGHLIGNHTWSHARLNALSPGDECREIKQSRDLIASWTNSPCRVFAWTFAWDAIDKSSWQVASCTHRYIFSACPGLNWADELDRQLIWRSNVDASANLGEVRFLYSGLRDLLWRRERRLLLATRRELGGPGGS